MGNLISKGAALIRRLFKVNHQTDSMNFNRDIKILTTDNEWILAMALLDTQCHKGNWISHRLVKRLGMLSLISTEFVSPKLFEASGAIVRASGVVNLNWKWHPQSTRIHSGQFYVLPHSDHLDVLFGVEYIKSERLLQVNELALIPLVQHKKSKKGDDAAIDQARERQQKEKAALDERKRQQKQKESKEGDNARQQ